LSIESESVSGNDNNKFVVLGAIVLTVLATFGIVKVTPNVKKWWNKKIKR
jgi:hypothetical protein